MSTLPVPRAPVHGNPARPVQLVLTTCRLCHATGQAPAGHCDDGPAECCPDCWGTGQRLVCRDVYSDLADDVRLCVQEISDYRGLGYVADILKDIADRIERLPDLPAAA
jgi:hypothetical protein